MAWDPALEAAFHPQVVAFVGVSATAKEGERGGAEFISCFEELGFTGRMYAVNPRVHEINGRKVYPSVTAIPEPVDLVVVSVPARAVPEVLEDCIAANARNVHVYTSGFEETGEKDGVKLGERVRQIALRGGLRLIGPNCVGLYVPSARIGPFRALPRTSGPVSMVSQSGGHLDWLSHYGPDYGVHFNKNISFGNASVLDSTDFLEHLAVDPETRIICMYLEGVKDGQKLLRQVREISRTKPVIILKGGRTEAGLRAVASHTAALAGQQAVWRAFFAQSGTVEVSSLEEMAEMAMTFLYVKPPPGKRVAVLGLGGGSGVASADVCSQEGMEVPELSLETQGQLRKFVPVAGSSVKNPLDTPLFRNVDLFLRELELVAADPSIDMLIVRPHLDVVRSAGPGQVERMIALLSDFCRNNSFGKPAVINFFSHMNIPWETGMRYRLMKELPQQGVPVYSSLSAASRALFKLWKYHSSRRQ